MSATLTLPHSQGFGCSAADVELATLRAQLEEARADWRQERAARDKNAERILELERQRDAALAAQRRAEEERDEARAEATKMHTESGRRADEIAAALAAQRRAEGEAEQSAHAVCLMNEEALKMEARLRTAESECRRLDAANVEAVLRAQAAERRLEEAREQKDGAYAERDKCVALIARMALALGCRAGVRPHEPDPDPTWDDDWKNVVLIDLPSGQVSWHYHDSERPLFAGLPRYDGHWDGHDTAEKYRRVLAASTAGGGGENG